MILAESPYSWYKYDLDQGICVLTQASKAIPEVVESYEAFYKLLSTLVEIDRSN